jgi:hypothetical protein
MQPMLYNNPNPLPPHNYPFPAQPLHPLPDSNPVALSSLDSTAASNTPYPSVSGNVMIDSLYSAMKLQCKQCGLRFNDGEKMSNHLDWHFKMNKRATNLAAKHSAHQNYYWTEEEWIESDDVVFGKSSAQPINAEADNYNHMNSLGKENYPMELDISGQQSKVIASSETSLYCPVCNDKFSTVWDDEEEVWLYEGAIAVTVDSSITSNHAEKLQKKKQIQLQYNGQILHILCYQSLFTQFEAKNIPSSPSTDNHQHNLLQLPQQQPERNSSTANNPSSLSSSIMRVLSSTAATLLSPFTVNNNKNPQHSDNDPTNNNDVKLEDSDEPPPLEVEE